MAITHQDSEVTITDIKGSPPTDIEQPVLDQIEEPDFVDGSVRGWVIVFAGFFAHMISMGFGNVYGVYQVTKSRRIFECRCSWIDRIELMTIDNHSGHFEILCLKL